LDKKKLKKQVKFHLQKSVWYIKPPIKSYGQISKRTFENVKKMALPTLLWNLSITFDWRLEISKGFLEMKFNLIFQLWFV